MNRYDYLLKSYREQKMRERKEKILMRTRTEVNVNGNGTSGYTVTTGPSKGKVLKHISINHENN
jgi:hypothetical protein